MAGAEQTPDDIEQVVAEAMAVAYRQGWDDCVAARTRPWWWRPAPAVSPHGRELLIADWVPSEVRAYADRITFALKRLIGR